MPHISSQGAAHRPLTPTAPPLESMQVEDRVIPDLVARARRQDTFYDDAGLTPAQFRATTAYGACRGELFLLFKWLEELLPRTGEDGALARTIGEQGRDWTAPLEIMSDAQVRMFGAGKHLMFELCKALEANPGRQTLALVCHLLRTGFAPGTVLDPRSITAIGRALSLAITAKDHDAAVRRREQALSKLEAWARVHKLPEWTPAEVAQGFLQYLGYDEIPDVMPDREFCPEACDAQVSNAAAHACALVPAKPLDSSITDRRFLDGAGRLSKCALQHGIQALASIDQFVDRFIGCSPTGGQIDLVGNLHRFGLPALELLCKRAEEPARDPARVRRVLDAVVAKIAEETRDPTRLLLDAVHYELPRADLKPGDRQAQDDARCRVIYEAVEHRAEGLLMDRPAQERRDLIDLAANKVMHLLGIAYTEGGLERPTTSGLIDVSTDNLEKLLSETRKQADRAVDRRRDPTR
jgi:hypothetical protein